MSQIFDKCGMTVSGLCGVHCFALVALSLIQPVVVAGAQALAWLRPLEILMVLAAAVFALIAFVSGYRHHGHAKPVALGTLGLMLLATSIATSIHDQPWAPVITFLGGMALIVGHRWNIRCRCRHAQANAAPIAHEETPA